MAKYNTRYEYTIQTSNHSQKSEDNWLSELDNRLTKEAVQPRRVDESLFSQINSIINSKSKYTSVDEAVKEMQRRSGFLDYNTTKLAQQTYQQNQPTVKLFEQYPETKETFGRYISDSRGHLPLPAILEHVQKLHPEVKDSSLWDEESLISYVNQLNESTKSNYPQDHHSNLGSIDRSIQDIDVQNSDAWHSLMPATQNK